MTLKKHSIELIKGILSQALDIEAGETREAFLNQACENDVQLRKEVEPPRRVVSKGDAPQWAPDRSKLYLQPPAHCRPANALSQLVARALQ